MTRQTLKPQQGCMARLALLVLIMSVVQYSYSHQMQYVVSTISIAANKPAQVTHRFELHDGEHALQALFKTKGNLSDNAELQQRFANYIIDNFLVKHQNAATQLALVGYESEGKYFWVYQESQAPINLPLYIESTVLFDIFPKQTHWLNVNKQGTTQSASLSKNMNFAVFEK